jgi:hypothetical protein
MSSVVLDTKHHVPKRYVPQGISRKDREKQKKSLRKSRKLYKRGVYYERPKIASFKSKPSGHVERAKRMFGVDSMEPSRKLSRRTGCTMKALKKIVKKGEGAYYSSGSRPNQTARSWGLARLASALTGGPASKVDHDILEEGCLRKTERSVVQDYSDFVYTILLPDYASLRLP